MPTPLTVVIITFRRPRLVRGAATAALAQLSPDDELLVVDDGSGDETLEVLRAIDDGRLRVVSQPNQGQATARNTGAREARHDVLVFLDDDEVPEPGLIEAHREAQAAGPGRVVMGRPILVVPQRRGDRTIPPGPRDTNALLADASMSMRRSELLAVGGYDVSMRGWEDIDLGIRFQQAGVRIEVAPGALVTHHIGRPYRLFRSQRLDRGRAQARGVARHGRGIVPPADPPRALDRALVRLAARNRVFAEVAAGMLWSGVVVGAQIGSWKLQAVCASRAGFALMAYSEGVELRRLGVS